jgi:hypothetical protein
VVDEFDLAGAARVDIAVVNGALAGIEIKSERDSLRRLARQVDAYGLVFDEVTVVAAQRHLRHVLEQVPAWWTVISVNGVPGEVDFNIERTGATNVSIDTEQLLWLLWRDELLDELATRHLLKGLRSKPRQVLCQRLASELDVDEIRSLVRNRLRARRKWRAAQ